MNGFDFLNNGGIPPRVGNAPVNGIDFRDLDYVCGYRELLSNPDWENVETEFRKTQPETSKIADFQKDYQVLVNEISPLNEQLQTLENVIADKEEKQKNEFDLLNKIATFKSQLLALLPEKFLDEGRIFLNNFIMQKNENNYFPGEGPKYESLKAKAEKLLFVHKLNKFKQQFEKSYKSFDAFAPRFNLDGSKEDVVKSIENFYGLNDLYQEKNDLRQKIDRVAVRQQELAGIIANERQSLDRKIERLKSYYDKKLFLPENYEDIPFSQEKEQYFERFETTSQAWRFILHECRLMNIHFSETVGLIEKDVPVAAIYDRNLNRILCNKAFSAEEQIYTVADIMTSIMRKKLSNDCDAKSRYQYELCRQAEKTAKMVVVVNELSLLLPGMKTKATAVYNEEMAVYMVGVNPTDKYAKVFVKALSSPAIRKLVENEVCKQIEEGQKVVIADRENFVPISRSLGEIVAPFVSHGAPLLNESPEMKLRLGQIPNESKEKIQALANIDKDYSLMDMAEFK